MRNYLSSMHRTLADRAASNEKISSQRAFNKVSENTAAAARAFSVRKQYTENIESLSAISNATARLSAAETNIGSINDIMVNVQESVTRVLNNTMPANQLEIIANEIDSLRDQILQFANARFGDKYLFSGSNNSTAPFMDVVGTGQTLFNGIDPDGVRKNPVSGVLEYLKSAPDVYETVPKNKDSYVDIGLGLTMKPSGEIDTRSAFMVETSGLNIFGYGTSDVNGKILPNNLCNLLSEISQAVRDQDNELLNSGLTQIQNRSEGLIMQMTDIGSRDRFLTQIKDRLENDNINLQAAQKALEGIDLEAEIINNKSYETAWLITLQLGSQVIPPSIFDFMR
jgi:flagellin-like hook-associated protein FlgL